MSSLKQGDHLRVSKDGEEIAWIETKDNELISHEYAHEIKVI